MNLPCCPAPCVRQLDSSMTNDAELIPKVDTKPFSIQFAPVHGDNSPLLTTLRPPQKPKIKTKDEKEKVTAQLEPTSHTAKKLRLITTASPDAAVTKPYENPPKTTKWAAKALLTQTRQSPPFLFAKLVPNIAEWASTTSSLQLASLICPFPIYHGLRDRWGEKVSQWSTLKKLSMTSHE